MKIKKLTYALLIALICPLGALAQQVQLMPFLISSTGGYGTGAGINLSYSVGEPMIQTYGDSSLFLTQGFQQPMINGAVLQVFVNSSNVTCIGANNGSAQAIVTSGTPPYTYTWTPLSTTSDSVSGLAPGVYSVVVTDANNYSVTDTVVVMGSQEDCGITIYSGFTPNGDGHNDEWYIDNIQLYPDNHVSIFNRWGSLVWQAKGYNDSDIMWDGTMTGGKPLPQGTYFYVVEIQGQRTRKGWVQLTR